MKRVIDLEQVKTKKVQTRRQLTCQLFNLNDIIKYISHNFSEENWYDELKELLTISYNQIVTIIESEY